jgi:hypothetical protein
MLPSNAPATFPIPGLFMSPDDRIPSNLRDYERGGVATGDPSFGLDVQDWQCWYESLEVRLAPADGAREILFTRAGVNHLSFSFDQNMRPVVAFTQDATTYLWWYDGTVPGFVFTDFGTDIITPRVGMDDRRAAASSTSDVIFAYIRYDAGTSSYALCYRQQRDRYTVERVLRTGLSERTRLKNIGMSANLRFQFELA